MLNGASSSHVIVGLLFRTYLCTSLNECSLPPTPSVLTSLSTIIMFLLFVFRFRVQLYPHLPPHL